MDKDAVVAADDALFRELGQVAGGDIIAVRAHCLNVNSKNVVSLRKEQLKSAIVNKRNGNMWQYVKGGAVVHEWLNLGKMPPKRT